MGTERYNPKNLLMATCFFAIVIVNNLNRDYIYYFVIPVSILIIILLYKLYKFNRSVVVNDVQAKSLKYFFIVAGIINIVGGYLIAHSKGII